MDFLLIMAVVPAAILLHYVYKIDPVEKEPGRLLARLLLLGALSCIPAIFLETLGLDFFFNGRQAVSIPDLLLENFIIIALSEELCKFVFLRLRTWNNPAFNYVFDGIVYAVFVSLGFAILENIGYVMEYGASTAIVRAFTAIPGHAIFGVFMGCFYGLAKRAQHAGQRGKQLGFSISALAVPVLCHGFYDFCASIDSPFADILFFAFLFGIMFVSMRLIKLMARKAHLVSESAYPTTASSTAQVYNPVVDNSFDGGAYTYTGPNQYGNNNPVPPQGFGQGPFDSQ